MVDGKARLIRDDYCDGLGACLPSCPARAIAIAEREAAAFDEHAALAHKKSEEKSIAGCPGTALKASVPKVSEKPVTNLHAMRKRRADSVTGQCKSN